MVDRIPVTRSDLDLPCSRALLNRNQPTRMNRYRPNSDFERQW
jgi:hypothetical protein